MHSDHSGEASRPAMLSSPSTSPSSAPRRAHGPLSHAAPDVCGLLSLDEGRPRGRAVRRAAAGRSVQDRGQGDAVPLSSSAPSPPTARGSWAQGASCRPRRAHPLALAPWDVAESDGSDVKRCPHARRERSSVASRARRRAERATNCVSVAHPIVKRRRWIDTCALVEFTRRPGRQPPRSSPTCGRAPPRAKVGGDEACSARALSLAQG